MRSTPTSAPLRTDPPPQGVAIRVRVLAVNCHWRGFRVLFVDWRNRPTEAFVSGKVAAGLLRPRCGAVITLDGDTITEVHP